MKETVSWLIHIVVAVLIGLLIVTFVAQMTVVKGQSMYPTLQDGNRLLIEKISPKINMLHKGDIITINTTVPGNIKETIIKRVIAVENDTVEIKDGKVFVNDKPTDEPYIYGAVTNPNQEQYSKMKIQKGQVYVLGDNRLNSTDSRIIGPQEISNVTGKVMVRVYPFNEIGKVP